MTVFSSYNSRINPGRRLDAVALASESAKLVERHGGGRGRLLATSIMGEQIDGLVFVIEFDSLGDFGAFTDEAGADSEVQALLDRVSGADSPVTPQAQLLTADVPIGRTVTAGHGAVSEIYIIRVQPGGLDAFIAGTQRWCDLVERNGALSSRLLTILHGGSQTGLFVSVAEYADHQTWGRSTEIWAASDEGLALSADLASGAIPAEIVSSGLYAEIPI